VAADLPQDRGRLTGRPPAGAASPSAWGGRGR
jgi:hypothetical protein